MTLLPVVMDVMVEDETSAAAADRGLVSGVKEVLLEDDWHAAPGPADACIGSS